MVIVCWVLKLTFDSLQPTGAHPRCPKEKEDRTTNARKSGTSHRVGPPRTTRVTKSDQTVKEWRGMTPPMPEWAPGRIQAQLKTHIQSSPCGAGSHTRKIKHFHEKIWLYTKTCLSLRIQNAVPGKKDKMILEE